MLSCLSCCCSSVTHKLYLLLLINSLGDPLVLCQAPPFTAVPAGTRDRYWTIFFSKLLVLTQFQLLLFRRVLQALQYPGNPFFSVNIVPLPLQGHDPGVAFLLSPCPLKGTGIITPAGDVALHQPPPPV